jgi:hypothetical protein
MKSKVTGKQDAPDTLLRLNLEGYGYTFVAKGTEAWVGGCHCKFLGSFVVRRRIRNLKAQCCSLCSLFRPRAIPIRTKPLPSASSPSLCSSPSTSLSVEIVLHLNQFIATYPIPSRACPS